MDTSTLGVEALALDPRTLLTDVNIRNDMQLDKDFIASVKDLGVLVPLVAVRTADGEVRVRFGHRRTLAAIEAGLETVPVHVVGNEATDDAGHIERIVGQYAENELRASLLQAERVGVVEQLSAFGLSPSQIQRRTRLKRASVDDALSIAGSDVAKAVTARYDFLTLHQAAAVADFDDDREAVKLLMAAAQEGRFDHVVAQMRENRTMRLAYETAETTLAEAGLRVIDRPGFGDTTTRLNQLRHDDEQLDESKHATCPGHAAFLDDEWMHPDDDNADDDDEGWSLVYRPVFVCTAPAEYGHSRPGSTRSTLHTSATAPEALAQEADQAAEEKRAARRTVLANNKAWRTAEPVRREWLSAFLGRKTPPKGALRFVISEVIHGAHELREAMAQAHSFGTGVLGIETQGSGWAINRQPILDAIDTASDGRAQVIALGLVLGAVETQLDVHTWLLPNAAARRYLAALAEWGYELSEVEQLVMGVTDTDEDDEDDDPDADDTDEDDEDDQ